jgi:glycosyltransferase involved in cell wall biosynthesis
MKVSIIGPAYPLRGGIAHHVYYLKRELEERHHAVQVISFSKLYPRLLFPGTTQFDTSAMPLDAQATALLAPHYPFTWLKAFHAVKAFSPDLVIFQWWHPFFAPMIGTLARLLRRGGFACVLECHNVFPHERSAVDVSLLKFAAKPIDAFITHSLPDQNDLLPFVSGQSVDTAPLPSPREFDGVANRTREGRAILFFGVVRKYKGLDVLLAALPKVLERVPARLEIAGEFYDSEDRYRQQIKALGLEQHVLIDNRYIPNEEIHEIFDRADVLILPYITATQSAVARMAISNGLPLIASNTGGLSEIVVDNETGFLFKSGDADDLANRIIEYFEKGLGPVFAANLRAATGADSKCGIVDLIERKAGIN